MTIKEKELEGLHESEARHRIVMETISDAIITIDVESTILFVNRGACKIFGYGAEELIGAKLTMLMPEFLRRAHEAGLGRYVETGQRHISWEGVELPGLHKTGRAITLEVSFGETMGEDGRRLFTGVARDITRRKRNERNLAAQYALTRILAEAPTTGEAVKGILQAVCENMGWEMGALWGVERGGGQLRVIEMWHSAEADVNEFERLSARRTFSRGDGMPGKVWETRAPLWVADIAADESFPRAPEAARAGIHGGFAFPVLVGGEAVGVIEFFSREVREPDDDLLAMMSNVGGQIGQVIERKRAEDERSALQTQIISMQEAQLEELSTPLIPITSDLIAMPLVGAMDSRRAQRMIDTLLGGIVEHRTPFAIIDITGVATVDTHVADALVRAAQSARLLGTEVILTGIRAGVARSLTGLGVDLQEITTRKDLQSGIAYALERLRRDRARLTVAPTLK